jgi:hypothetical protein
MVFAMNKETPGLLRRPMTGAKGKHAGALFSHHGHDGDMAT